MSIVSSSSLLRLLPSTALWLASCQQLDPEFCASHPQDVDCARRFGSGIDAGMCTVNEQCSDPTPVCDTARSMCVACTAVEPGACGGPTPVCGSDDACHACTTDPECASQTCLPDGSCASLLDVLYATRGGSDLATCMPDDRCSLARAISLIDGTKSTIRLDPGHYNLLDTLSLPHDLRLVGRDAVLDRNAADTGVVLRLAPGTTIGLDYLTVQGGDGAGGGGIECTGSTLTLREVTIQGNADGGIGGVRCALAISHSEIRNNGGPGIAESGGSLAIARSRITGNQNGGVVVDGASGFGLVAYDIENTVIAKNGGPSSGFSAVEFLGISVAAPHVFAFNTVAQNQTPLGTVAGVRCDGFSLPLALTSSIVVDNGAGAQVEGSNCSWTYSDIAPVAVAGTGNLSSDPLFVDPLHNNFHLQSASPVRDAADPAATLAVDIDGDTRPQGAGRDMGADEIQ